MNNNSYKSIDWLGLEATLPYDSAKFLKREYEESTIQLKRGLCKSAVNLEIEDLRFLYPHSLKLLYLVKGENVRASQLYQAVYENPLVAAKVLQVVNSKRDKNYFVSSLQDALSKLNSDEVRNIIFPQLLGASKRVEISKEPPELLFWKHSLSCGYVARFIAEQVGISPEEGYLAGLLHDIGKYALSSSLSSILDNMGFSVLPMPGEIEQIYSSYHAGIGKVIAEKWKFPSNIISAISYHHAISKAPEAHKKLTAVVHVADLLCQVLIEETKDKDSVGPDEGVKYLKLTKSQLLETFEKFPRIKRYLTLLQ